MFVVLCGVLGLSLVCGFWFRGGFVWFYLVWWFNSVMGFLGFGVARSGWLGLMVWSDLVPLCGFGFSIWEV